MRAFAFVFLTLAISASAAMVSESRITVTDSKGEQTVVLPVVYGDWFTKPDIDHAAFALVSGSGPAKIQLAIGWERKDRNFKITAADLRDIHEASDFTLHRGNGNALPKDADAIEIAIAKLDTFAVEATFTGTVHDGDERLSVSGVVKVHRDPTYRPLSSGAWHDCDPVIYDHLTFAEFLSPSECEAKFDVHAREVFAKALAPVASTLTAGDWNQTRTFEVKPINALPRKSETSPYDLKVQLQFRVKPGSEQGKRNAAVLQAMSGKIADAMKSPPRPPHFRPRCCA